MVFSNICGILAGGVLGMTLSFPWGNGYQTRSSKLKFSMGINPKHTTIDIWEWRILVY